MNVEDWIQGSTILRVRHGSMAYGTNIEGSDEDIRGVCVAPREYYYGYLLKFEQFERKEPDTTIFDLRKFCRLAADGNPNALEILFVERSDVLFTSSEGEHLLANRDLFLSKKLKHTLSGYAYAQVKRIETHRKWLLDPPSAAPTRAAYDLPERTVIPADQLAVATALITKQLEAWRDAFNVEGLGVAERGEIARVIAEMRLASDEEFRAAGRVIGISENFMAILDNERRYAAAKATFDQFLQWKKNRNEARSETERKFGYDTKHGMHVIRLMRACCEVLETGKLQVRRPDAEELIQIRRGAWSYGRLKEEAAWLHARADELYKTSKLPESANHKGIDKLCVALSLSQHAHR